MRQLQKLLGLALCLAGGSLSAPCPSTSPTPLEKMQAEDELAQFVELLQQAELADKFDDKKYVATVFAPQNTAVENFVKLSPSLQEQPALVKELMKYHIIEEEQFIEFTGLAEKELQTNLTDEDNFLCPDTSKSSKNFGMLVVKPAEPPAKATVTSKVTSSFIAKSYQACGVTIHVISSVLLPCSSRELQSTANLFEENKGEKKDLKEAKPPAIQPNDLNEVEPVVAPEEGIELEACTSLADVLLEQQLTIFSALVSTHGVQLFVDNDFTGTVFAPTDEAFEALFEALGVNGGDFEGADNAALNLMLYHLTGEVINIEDTPNISTVTTFIDTDAEGICANTVEDEFTIKLSAPGGSRQKIIQTGEQGTVKFEQSDIPICGGMLHIIDSVLLPCELDPEELGSDVVEGNTLDNKIKENKEGKSKSKKKNDDDDDKALSPEEYDDLEAFGPFTLDYEDGEGIVAAETRLEEELKEKMYQQLRFGTQPLNGVEPVFARPSTCATPTLSVYDWLKDRKEYWMFLSLINLSGLTELFANPRADFTLFLPTNDAIVRAFQYLGKTPHDVYDTVDKGEMWLRTMVMYHATEGKRSRYDLREMSPAKVKSVMADIELQADLEIYDTPCSGGLVKEATFTIAYTQERGLAVQGGKTIAEKEKNDGFAKIRNEEYDIETCGSVIHTIDGMMWPCDFKGERCGSLGSALVDRDDLSTFRGLMARMNDSRIDLDDVAVAATVFAFDDRAWQRFIVDNEARNLPSTRTNSFFSTLSNEVLKYHISTGGDNPIELSQATSFGGESELAFQNETPPGGIRVDTVADSFEFCKNNSFNSSLGVYQQGESTEVRAGFNSANVKDPDLPACNSLIHVIDKVLLPCRLTPPPGYDEVRTQPQVDVFEDIEGDEFTLNGVGARSASVVAVIFTTVSAFVAAYAF